MFPEVKAETHGWPNNCEMRPVVVVDPSGGGGLDPMFFRGGEEGMEMGGEGEGGEASVLVRLSAAMDQKNKSPVPRDARVFGRRRSGGILRDELAGDGIPPRFPRGGSAAREALLALVLVAFVVVVIDFGGVPVGVVRLAPRSLVPSPPPRPSTPRFLVSAVWVCCRRRRRDERALPRSARVAAPAASAAAESSSAAAASDRGDDPPA